MENFSQHFLLIYVIIVILQRKLILITLKDKM